MKKLSFYRVTKENDELNKLLGNQKILYQPILKEIINLLENDPSNIKPDSLKDIIESYSTGIIIKEKCTIEEEEDKNTKKVHYKLSINEDSILYYSFYNGKIRIKEVVVDFGKKGDLYFYICENLKTGEKEIFKILPNKLK